MTAVGGAGRLRRPLARGAAGLLRAFNEAGILSTSDVHVALRLARLGAVTDELVWLGAAFAARAPAWATSASTSRPSRDREQRHRRAGRRRRAAVARAGGSGSTPWPRSPLVGDGPPAPPGAGPPSTWTACGPTSARWPRTCWTGVGAGRRRRRRAAGVRPGGSSSRETDDPDFQRLAAATAVLRRVSVIAGGPGTGKTTTVARVLALLSQARREGRPPLVALAAPTGKAAARLEEAVRREAADHGHRPGRCVNAWWRCRARRCTDCSASIRATGRGSATTGSTGWRHDVVVVDETSMVSLSMMARLVEAVRPDARLILVGDPEQLASVEAGAVLGDIVAPPSPAVCMGEAARERLAGGDRAGSSRAPRRPSGRPSATASSSCAGCTGSRGRDRRAGPGDPARATRTTPWRCCEAGEPDVRWVSTACRTPTTLGDAGRRAPARRRERSDGAWRPRAGRRRRGGHRGARPVPAALRAPPWARRCGHMDAPRRELAPGRGRGIRDGAEWYVGRPLIVTENDYGLQLYNGDIGVVVEADGTGDGGRLRAGRRDRPTVSPDPAGRGGHRLRHDGAQEPGIAVRHGGLPAAGRRLAGPDPRAALHRGHPCPGAADRGGSRGARSGPRSSGRSRGRRACGGPCGARPA